MKNHRPAAERRLQRSVFLALMLLPLAVGTSPATAAVASLSVSQAVQLEAVSPAIRVFLEVGDQHGISGMSVAPEQITATLGQNVLRLSEAYPFRSHGQGVAYVFLVDVSASLSQREFELILEALDVWILSLRPADRVAVIAFGDRSQVLVDFTRDQTRIKSALYSLAPTDRQTVLHEALAQGIELCSRRDPDLPGRRVMIVLTDGRDEGSGLTADDVLASIRRDPIPIYAIGVSRIQDAGQRRRYLDLLRRFSANSGGTFHEATTAALGEAYESIRRAIHDVTVADFTCPDCPADGEEYRLQVQIEDGGRVLTAGRSLRLFPPTVRRLEPQRELLAAPGPLSESAALPVDSPDADAAQQAADSPAADLQADGPAESAPGARAGSVPVWIWVLLAALALALAWSLLRRRTPAVSRPPAEPAPSERESAATATAAPSPVEPRPESDDDEPGSAMPAPAPIPQKYTLDSGIETTRPPRPAIMRLVRLIVVRGAKPGRQYTLTLFKNAVVGSRSTCDSVLADPGVAPEQFELLQHDGRVYIRNLAGTNPTLVDGLTLTEQYPLKSGSLVGNRDFIIRIVYEDARPINT